MSCRCRTRRPRLGITHRDRPDAVGSSTVRGLSAFYRSLGVDSDTELAAVLDRSKMRAGTRRGDAIIACGRSPMHSTPLLDGVACRWPVGSPSHTLATADRF